MLESTDFECAGCEAPCTANKVQRGEGVKIEITHPLMSDCTLFAAFTKGEITVGDFMRKAVALRYERARKAAGIE